MARRCASEGVVSVQAHSPELWAIYILLPTPPPDSDSRSRRTTRFQERVHDRASPLGVFGVDRKPGPDIGQDDPIALQLGEQDPAIGRKPRRCRSRLQAQSGVRRERSRRHRRTSSPARRTRWRPIALVEGEAQGVARSPRRSRSPVHFLRRGSRGPCNPRPRRRRRSPAADSRNFRT